MNHRYSLLPILLFLLLLSVTPTQAQDLNAMITASREVVGPGTRTTFSLTVSNTGSDDLTDIAASVQLPAHINRLAQTPPGFVCSFSCDANEVHGWDIGTLAPGESRTTFFRAQISDGAPAETITLSMVVSSTGSDDATASLDVVIDLSPLVELSLTPEGGPAEPGEPLTYTLTYGNVGSTNATGVVLSMPVPEGTNFVSATGGGTLEGGEVSWPIGALGVGASGDVRLDVELDESVGEGDIIEAVAELDPNSAGEPVARSSASVAVRSGVDLQLAYTASTTAPAPGERVTFALTATNTGAFDLTNASALLLFPGSINRLPATPPGFSCSFSCDANEVHGWNIGTLAPGESRTTFFRTQVSGNAPQGAVRPSLLQGQADGTGPVSAVWTYAVDPSPVLRLSLAPEGGPAEPGEPLTYTLTYGNVGSTNATGVVLSMPVPEGTNFVSATGGGTPQDGVMRWSTPLGVEEGGQVELVVIPDQELPEGTILRSVASIDPGPDATTDRSVQSTAATPVRSGVPLDLDFSVAPVAIEPGGSVSYTLEVTNTGSVDLTDVVGRFLFPGSINRLPATPPGFSCSFSCDANEVHGWNIGTLAPGESRITEFSPSVTGGAVRGTFLNSRILVTASGSNEVTGRTTALVGEQILVSNETDSGMAETFALGVEAYPSPFGGAATFRLSLPDDGDVRLTVYDVLGRVVGTVVQEPMAAGRHEVRWNARSLPSGVYFYRLDTPQGARTGSLVKVR